MVEGPLDFEMVGVISEITTALAKAEIPVFVISTYDTDYILVKADVLEAAIDALKYASMELRWP